MRRRSSPNVGRPPRFIIPSNRPRDPSTCTAYTPSGGSSFRESGDVDVERRESEQPAPRIARDDRPAHRIRPPQKRARARRARPPRGHGARACCSPAPRPPSARATRRPRRSRATAPSDAEQRDVALAPAAEAVIVADQQLGHPEARAAEWSRRTRRRAAARARGVNGTIATQSSAVFASRRELLVARREQAGRGRRVDDLERVRLEGHEQAGATSGAAHARRAGQTTSRWPQCTPSKVPTVTTVAPTSAGSSASPPTPTTRTLTRPSA